MYECKINDFPLSTLHKKIRSVFCGEILPLFYYEFPTIAQFDITPRSRFLTIQPNLKTIPQPYSPAESPQDFLAKWKRAEDFTTSSVRRIFVSRASHLGPNIPLRNAETPTINNSRADEPRMQVAPFPRSPPAHEYPEAWAGCAAASLPSSL
ncbi:hypothetical protein J6590_001125 [Homalodisca vitripennis]|nr:hypothetical protein J6590_001125 [Homalodisca vitripennis]